MKTTTSSDDFSQYTLVLFLFAFENIVFRYPSTNPFQLKQIHNESSANSGNVGPNPRKVTASPYAIRNEDLLSPNTENLDPEMSSSGEILQQQPTSDGKEKLDASQNNNNSNNSMKSKLRRKNNKKNTTQDDAGASSSASLLDTGNNNHRNSQTGATIHRHNKKKNLTTSNDTDGKPTAEEATAKSLRRPFSTVSFASEVHTSDHGLNEVEGEYIPSVLSSSALDASYNGMIASAVESLTNNSLNTTTNNNASGAAVDTSCVGVAPLTLMHLLGGLGNTVNSRNSSSHNNIVGCTTVSVDNITFLVFPVPLRGDKQTSTKPNSKSTSDTQCHPNNNKSVATFVLAMSSPDVENGNISRFFQCFINIILREEVRLSYISAQLSLISNVWALYENNTNPSSTNNEDGGMTGSHPGNRSLYNTNKGQRQQKQAKKNKIENTLLTAENLKQKINPKCPAKAIFDSTESLPSGATDTPRSGEQKKGEEERAAEEPERTGSSEESGDRPRRGVPSAASSRSDSPPASSAPSYRRPTVANDPMNNPNATATGTKSSVYDFLLQAALQQDKGTRFTLGKELMEVVDVIHTWNVKFRPLPRRKVLQELLLLSENRSREGVTPVLPRGIPVNQLLFLPLSHLTGVQLPPSSVTPAGAPVETNHPGSMDEEESGVMGDESRQGLLFSLFARLHPCGLIYLAKDLKKFNTSGEESSEFLTHLEREYEIILGKRYSRLLPLKMVITECLVNLKVPWRVGAFYKSVELALLKAINERKMQQNHNSDLSSIQTAGLSFIVLEVLEFLRAREVLVVDDGVSLWFTHGTLLPPIPPPLLLNENTSLGTGKWKKRKAEAMPQTVLLTMLCRLQSEMKHGGSSGRHNILSTSNHLRPNQDPHPMVNNLLSPITGTSADGSVTSSQKDRKPLSSLLKLEVKCVWGSACPYCESLAFHPSHWYVSNCHADGDLGDGNGGKLTSRADSAVLLLFPALDDAVMACASHHMQSYVSLHATHGASSPTDGKHTDTQTSVVASHSVFDTSAVSFMRPWFLKPHMYLVPSTMHCLSAYKMYQQLVSNEDDGGQGDGAGHGGEACHKCMPPTQGSKIPSSFFSTTTLDELNAAIDTDHRRPSMENFNKGSTTSGGGGTTNRVYHFISNDDEEGNIVLLKDVISSDAKRYLGEMEVTIRERLNATYQRQVEVEKKASKCFVLQPECTDKAPHSAAQSNPELTISSATEDSKTSTSEGGVRPMKYTKRILQDRSALYAKSLSPTLSIPPPSEQRSNSSVTISPPSRVYGQSDDTAGSGPLFPLQLVKKTLPLTVLLQIALHQMIAILWGRQGMDVDVLTRQLERNLRRLRPFLLEMTHVFDMVEKGLTSKILLTQRRAMLHQQKRKVTRSKGEREFPREPFDTLEEETAIPTTQQIQLLQTYELYDSLVLLPCLAPHFGATVQVVPTSLLIHAVVNEFSDVLLIGGASESGSEKFRLDAAAL